MPKLFNYLRWPQVDRDNESSQGSGLVALLVTLAIATLLINAMASVAISATRAYRSTTNSHEALHNAYTAMSWLQKDLQSARTAVTSAGNKKLTVSLPRALSTDRTQLQWYRADYLVSNKQLLRSINNSNNLVASGVINFQVIIEEQKPAAMITITCQCGNQSAELTSVVYLRNMGK